MKKFISILLVLPFLFWTGIHLWKAKLEFNPNCCGYMQNACASEIYGYLSLTFAFIGVALFVVDLDFWL